MTHCWTDYGEWIEETYGYLSEEYIDYAASAYDKPVDWAGEICVLPVGHFGPHEWTLADEIVAKFV